MTAQSETALRVGTTGDYRPVTWWNPDTGSFEGTAIDLIAAFAGDRGYRIEFVKTTWPALMQGLQDGIYRVAAGGISATKARARLSLMSDSVATTGKVALVRSADKARFQTLDQIDSEGIKVVENPGGTNENFARGHLRHATLTVVPNNLLPFEYLRDGRADVMFTDSTEAVYIQNRDGALCAVRPNAPYARVEKVFLFRKGEEALRDEFDAWLSKKR